MFFPTCFPRDSAVFDVCAVTGFRFRPLVIRFVLEVCLGFGKVKWDVVLFVLVLMMCGNVFLLLLLFTDTREVGFSLL